ncbi:MAG: efflux RND transporter periplasmic adaptor subunit [Planctomycetes bacterium]|nr:efflux RND transporter periplasmic adaptor subunit [Planctomycetota bacterium]
MFKFMGQGTVGHSAALCALLVVTAGCAPDTTTVPAAQAEDEGPEPVAVTVFTDKVELFMEYPRLVPGLEAHFLAHVTVLETGEPVRSGQLRLELSPITGAPKTLEAPKPAREGLFIPVGSFDTSGHYDARIVVKSDQVEETIQLQPIVVHADLKGAYAAAEADGGEDPKDAVPFLLEQQWRIGLLMAQAERRALTQRLQVPGEVEAPHHAMAVVSAPLAGRLLPPESGRLPRIGDRVEKGQVLALLEPPLTTSDTAQLVANETYHDTLEMELLVREFDVQAKALEVEQALQQSQARLEFARQALVRIEGLREKDLGTVAELEAARRDVAMALREGEGSQALKESFAQAKERLDVLRTRRASVRCSATPSGPQRHALVAPISGEIVEADHVEGEHIESQGAIYRVLDLSRVWIATYVSEFDLAGVGDAPGALLKFAAHPDRSFDVLGELDGRVVNVGRVVDPETRTIALRYEATNPGGLFRAGMFADVFLETKRAVDAVAVSEDAIVMDNGRPVAFVLVDGETFEKRVLELGIRDGRFAEIRDGIQEGERVVTKGAYLVKLASASPASFGEGHAH